MGEDRIIMQRDLNVNIKNSLLYSPTSLQMISDIASITIANIIHYFFRFESGIFETNARFDIVSFVLVNTILVLFWLSAFFFGGLYRNWYIRSPFDELFTLLKVTFIGNIFVFFVVFFDSNSQSPRLLFLIYFLFLSFLSITGRQIIRLLQKKLRMNRVISLQTLLIGNKDTIIEMFNKTEKSPAWGYKSTGFIALDNTKEIKDLSNLGNIENLETILKENKFSEIFITTDTSNHSLLMKIVYVASESNVSVKILPDLYDIFTGQVRTLPLYGIPLIDISYQLLKPWQEVMKRFIDLVFSAFVLIAGFPFWVLIAIILKLDSPGPAIYKQERVGKDGKSFIIYKFRTMRTDSEKNGPSWTSVKDSRVTKFGYFLRKSHLDEIPQFWNILIGDMSIVGPRPEMKFFVEKFSAQLPYYRRRLVVRPGLTGWWQVNYKPYVESIEEIENRLKDDFYYIENMSIRLDIEIIIRTVFVVLKGHGQA
jgi:exopolysaccharide biosynthesis polyprenyl glycosylphosphotransferase